MRRIVTRSMGIAALATVTGCAATPENTATSTYTQQAVLKVEAPAGASCYRSNPSRDRTLRAHLLALQEGTMTPEQTVDAIKQSIVDAGFPFNQVPAAESAAAYALSGGDLAAWEKAYIDYAEPGETDRTTFLNSLCWL